MMMFKPFALIAACALGLTSMANPVAAQVCLGIPRYCGLDGCPACECSGRRLTKLDDPFLFLDGKYDEDAQEHLAQRRKLQLCYCGSDTSTPVTQSECCDGCGKGKGKGTGDDRRRLIKGAPKGTKSPSTKSCKSEGEDGRRLSKRRALASAEEKKLMQFVPVAKNREDELPWAAPAVDGAELLAADPGIWTLPEFFDEELAEKIKALVDKYGNDLGQYHDCSLVNRAPINPEEKKCFRFTPSLAETDKDDSELYLKVRAKIKSIWPQFRLRDYFTVLDQKGYAGPVDYHLDGLSTWHMPATVIIYLTDGEEGTGGDTVFPLVGENVVSVSPRKGTALTWLNVHADGLIKENSIHGVQATTDESSGRTILTQKFFLSPEEFSELIGQTSSAI